MPRPVRGVTLEKKKGEARRMSEVHGESEGWGRQPSGTGRAREKKKQWVGSTRKGWRRGPLVDVPAPSLMALWGWPWVPLMRDPACKCHKKNKKGKEHFDCSLTAWQGFRKCYFRPFACQFWKKLSKQKLFRIFYSTVLVYNFSNDSNSKIVQIWIYFQVMFWPPVFNSL